MTVQQRGGFPLVRDISVDVSGNLNGSTIQKYEMPVTTTWLEITPTDDGVYVYFSQDDFDQDNNPLAIPAGSPRAAPMEVRQLWFRAFSGTAAVNLLMIQKG